MSFFTELFMGFISDILRSVCDLIIAFVAGWNTLVIQVNQTEAVARVVLFTTALGLGLAAFVVVKQVIGTYGIGNKGDPDQDSMEITYRICLMVGAMGMNSWLFTELTSLANLIANDISTAIGGVSEQTVADTLVNYVNNAGSNFVTCSISGVLVMGTAFFAISGVVRGAEITLSKILLPIFALDLINSNSERWNMFIFQYGINFLSFLVQMGCYQFFVYQMTHLDMNVLSNALICIGWLVVSFKTPKWLEKFIYASNAGQSISRGASRIGQVLTYVVARR